MRPLLVRLKSWLGGLGGGNLAIGRQEGAWFGPFFGTGELGGAYAMTPLEEGWQRNLAVGGAEARLIPAAYAAVMSNARAVSQCYATHKRITSSGKHETVTTSAASRVLRKPNGYETWPQFILNMVAGLLFDGEALAASGRRNGRGEIEVLHRMPRGSWQPFIAQEASEPNPSVFYSVGDAHMAPDIDNTDFLVPQRDVLHLRMYCPRHPLVGESPIKAAALAAGINVALARSQMAFFTQMRRPSGVLSTEQPLDSKAIETLRTKFDQQSKLWAQGGFPILSHGLKFLPFSINSQDAQLIQAQDMSIQDIARVYGTPPPVIGDLSHATLTNVEQLVNWWLSMMLGSLLEHIERSLDALFELPPNEYIELDTAALLRTDFAGRIDALAKGITGGLFAPNEAREREGLPPVDAGAMPRVQQQMVPLDWTAPAPPAPPAPAPPAEAPPPEPVKELEPEAARSFYAEQLESEMES